MAKGRSKKNRASRPPKSSRKVAVREVRTSVVSNDRALAEARVLAPEPESLPSPIESQIQLRTPRLEEDADGPPPSLLSLVADTSMVDDAPVSSPEPVPSSEASLPQVAFSIVERASSISETPERSENAEDTDDFHEAFFSQPPPSVALSEGRAGWSSSFEDDDPFFVDERLVWKHTPEVALRRARFTSYVTRVVGVATLVCVVAILRSLLLG